MEAALVVLTNCQLDIREQQRSSHTCRLCQVHFTTKVCRQLLFPRSQKKRAFPQGNRSGAVRCWRSPAMHHIMSQWLIAVLQTPAISERVTGKKNEYIYIYLDCSQWYKRKQRKRLTQCPDMNVAYLHSSFKKQISPDLRFIENKS